MVSRSVCGRFCQIPSRHLVISVGGRPPPAGMPGPSLPTNAAAGRS